MPTSVLLVAERAVTYAGTITPTPATVLDVGPGYGKYGVLLREYLDPTPEVDAVEAWQPYIDNHGLRGIYSTVFHADAYDMDDDLLDYYDLIVMGDVIEHMGKDRALEFIDRCRGWVVIATPVDFFHTEGDDLPPTEAHVSHWTVDDFQGTGRLDRHEECYGALIVRLAPKRADDE